MWSVIGHFERTEKGIAGLARHQDWYIGLPGINSSPGFGPQAFGTSAMIAMNVRQKDSSQPFPIKSQLSHFHLHRLSVTFKTCIDHQ